LSFLLSSVFQPGFLGTPSFWEVVLLTKIFLTRKEVVVNFINILRWLQSTKWQTAKKAAIKFSSKRLAVELAY
jgi:hypothetical protein